PEPHAASTTARTMVASTPSADRTSMSQASPVRTVASIARPARPARARAECPPGGPMTQTRPTADARARVAAEARAVAEAWSTPGSPASWRLTAAVFTALADDEDLLGLAAAVPPDRHPALLFVAASRRLVAQHRPPGLARAFPRPGAPQPPLEPGFAAAYRGFLLRHRNELAALLAGHRYQMNEV